MKESSLHNHLRTLDEVRWGSIGCGNVMEVKSGPALQQAEHSDLVAVMRRHENLARDFAQRHGIRRWYSSAVDLVKNPEINAVYIATPPDSHLEYTRLAAEAGKAVYVEKPMANSYAECLEMIRVCESSQVPLFVAYYRRALPRFLKIKALLDSGILGEIQGVTIQLLHQAKAIDIQGRDNWRVKPEIAGCGYFCDLGSHILDLLQFFWGDIRTADGQTKNTGGYYPAEDYVAARFEFENGIQGQGVWNFNASEDLDQTVITGSRGSLGFSFFTNDPVTLKTDSGNEEFNIPNPRHIQQPLIQLMVATLRGQGTCPSTGYSAAKTNRVIDMILGRRLPGRQHPVS